MNCYVQIIKFFQFSCFASIRQRLNWDKTFYQLWYNVFESRRKIKNDMHELKLTILRHGTDFCLSRTCQTKLQSAFCITYSWESLAKIKLKALRWWHCLPLWEEMLWMVFIGQCLCIHVLQPCDHSEITIDTKPCTSSPCQEGYHHFWLFQWGIAHNIYNQWPHSI